MRFFKPCDVCGRKWWFKVKVHSVKDEMWWVCAVSYKCQVEAHYKNWTHNIGVPYDNA